MSKVNKKHTATRICSEIHCYRGYEITLNTSVPTGYWGRYSAGGVRTGMEFATLKDAKVWVDRRLEKHPEWVLTTEENKQRIADLREDYEGWDD